MTLALTACTSNTADPATAAVDTTTTAPNSQTAKQTKVPTDGGPMTGFILLETNTHSVRVMSIDPTSGALTDNRRFDVSAGLGSAPVFNNGYTKAVAHDNVRDGSSMDRHAGYLTTDGTFHDMSALAPAVGDFESATDTAVGFDDNDAFYFTRKSAEDTIYKVTDGSETAEPVPFTKAEWNNGKPIINGDGTLNGRATSGKPWCASGVDDIFVAKELCLNISLDTYLYTYDMIVGEAPAKADLLSPDDPKEPNKRQLLPMDNKRKIDSTVFNADGTQVAFLVNEGSLGGAMGGIKQFYTISLDDLTVTHIETNPSLDKILSGSVKLIDW